MRLYVALTAAALLAACATNGSGTGSNGASVVAQATPAETTAATDSAAVAEADAAAPAEAAPVSDSKAAKDPNKIRCKYMPVTGSRMGRKVCHTVAEWEQMEKAAQEYMREINRQPTGEISPDAGA